MRLTSANTYTGPTRIQAGRLDLAHASAAAGSVITHYVGRPLIGLNFQQERYEADFRFNLVRLRENAEGVALYQGEASERRGLLERFENVRANWWELMRYTKRLTTATGLDDGPEYSPDGKYIYFNTDRTGKMEIWRMHPDGSGHEAVIADDIFTSDHDWAMAVCEEFIRRGSKMVWTCTNGIRVDSARGELFSTMKRAGCYRVHFGFESGNDDVLKAFGKGGRATLDQGIRLEQDLYVLLQTTADRGEGIAAFLEKRPPQWRNA